MLNIGDKIYLHIGELDKSIEKANFNQSRLCKIVDIIPARTEKNEEVGIYKLKSIFTDNEYSVMSNDNLWRMSEVDKLVEVVKASPSLDDNTKEKIIEKIYEQ